MSVTLKSAYDLSAEDWALLLQPLGAKPYVGKQCISWLFQKRIFDPLDWTNLNLEMRVFLKENLDWTLPEVASSLVSEDQSEKLVLKFKDGALVECVIMPFENHVTICVSSQVGCKMACSFCQTGKIGYKRNLTQGEILAQLLQGYQQLAKRDVNRRISHVVFMGMGEPLDNYEAVVSSCKLLLSPLAFGLSKHHVTVSTSGVIPEIERLGADVPVALAISLHSPFEEERSKLMPINKKYPLENLKETLLRYPVQTRHGITFEYIMIKDLNDSIKHAKGLVKFLHGLKAKVNLIPMNPHPGSDFAASTQETMRAFQQYLGDRSIPAPIRYSKAPDVAAACGQLAARLKSQEVHIAPRTIALQRRKEYLQSKV